LVAEGYDAELEKWGAAVSKSAALTARIESKAKAHGFKDKIPQTTALYPKRIHETLLNTRQHVSWVCLFLFFFFLFSFFRFLFFFSFG
jgi:hypothetical protein